MRSQLFSRAFIACWCALATYCLLSVIAGPAGVIAYRELDARQRDMSANLAVLRDTNASLSSELDSLKVDPDRAGREARVLGYLAPGETALVLPGLPSGGQAKRLEAGAVLRMAVASPLTDGAIKEISLLLGLVVFAVGLARELGKSPVERRSSLKAYPGSGS